MDLFTEKTIKPMLIKDMEAPFDSPNYIYELKLDGLRCIAYLDENLTELRNKRNLRLLSKFPELKDINKQVKERCILDGELIVLKNGVPDFFELQHRSLLTDTFKMQLSYSKFPASFVAYDILYIKDHDTLELPLMERKKLLKEVVIENETLAVSRYIKEQGIELFNLAKKQNLEGVVAKVMDSKYYLDKRTKDWIKFKFLADKDFVICGYIPKENGITSLILGQYHGDELVYKGHVTFGVRTDFATKFNCKILPSSPIKVIPSNNEGAIWLEPNLVGVVQYMPNEKDILRQPVFKGIRDDVSPFQCKE